jgi:hypothetical protein
MTYINAKLSVNSWGNLRIIQTRGDNWASWVGPAQIWSGQVNLIQQDCRVLG